MLSEGDALTYHLGQNFSTRDQDNDEWRTSCAVDRHGAWWYKSCAISNLNGRYMRNPRKEHVEWRTWKSGSLKFTEMKIRNGWGKMSCSASLCRFTVDTVWQ